MRKTKSLSITLPLSMADMVTRKVESGEYASESEVIRDGLRALRAYDEAFEHWLRTEGVERHRASIANPDDVVDAAALDSHLKNTFAELRKRKSRHAA